MSNITHYIINFNYSVKSFNGVQQNNSIILYVFISAINGSRVVYIFIFLIDNIHIYRQMITC